MTRLKNFADIVLDNPLAKPEAVALVERDRRVSYAALRQRIVDVAGFLLDSGLARGDRVGVLMPNCIEFVEIYLACSAAGMVLVPLNIRQLADEQQRILDDAGASTLFVSPAYAERADLLRAALPLLKMLVVTGTGGDDPRRARYDSIGHATAPPPLPEVTLEDPAVILYTSGTTSLPKGAILTHGNLLANLQQYQATVMLPAGGVNLQLSPLFHAASIFCFVHLMLGGSTVLLDKVEPAAILAAIEREKVTFVFTVPTILYQMLDHPERDRYDLGSLRVLQYGAAPITGTRLQQALQVFGYRLMHSYGLTESTSHVSILGCQEHESAAGSVGRPLTGVTVHIVDDEGRDCPTDGIGEIWVRGGNVFAGYWRRPEATRDTLRDGWLRTGDLGRIDARGYLFIVGRMKDLIISGGTNIYPTEIEDALMRHPAVAQAAAFGVPDALWGEAVAAAVVLRPGMAPGEAELISHLRGVLGGYKVPKVLRVLDDLPKNATGKILKRELVKMETFYTPR